MIRHLKIIDIYWVLFGSRDSAYIHVRIVRIPNEKKPPGHTLSTDRSGYFEANTYVRMHVYLIKV